MVRFFKKELPQNPLFLPNGKRAPFRTVKAGVGILATNDEHLLAELDKVLIRRIGGMIEIKESDYLQLCDPKQQKNSDSPKSESFQTPHRSHFYHSGDLGDIIASLIAVRELGGGEVFLGPDNQTTMGTREKMTPERAALIIPLLESQPYIHSASFSQLKLPTVKYDLNQMRTIMRMEYVNGRQWINLAQIYLKGVGLDIGNDRKPWLEASPKAVAPVVIARSARHHSTKPFDWKRIVSTYRGQTVFVGTKDEHAEFCSKFGRIPHEQTANLLELARVIAGAKLFVGNQSCPYWIAEALKKQAILEVHQPIPNSMFNRQDLIHGVDEKTVLPVIGRVKPKRISKKDTLVIRGPVDNFSGFGQIVQAIALGINNRGVKVGIAPTMISKTDFQPDIPPLSRQCRALLVDPSLPGQVIISMHCGLPHLVLGGEVVMTMWESTRINPETCDALNKASRVIVPSMWSATSFNACGVDTPFSIVPLGIDNAFKPKPWPKTKTFVFGAAGRIAHGGIRKGIEEVMAAFVRAFPKDESVRLEIKCYRDCPINELKDHRIFFKRDFFPNLSSWYAGLNCFVSASRGEGWGLQPHQAMGVGRPVIAPKFSGLSAFFDDSCGWPVKFDLKPAGGYYEGKGIWAEIDVDDLAAKMRHVFENQDEAIEKGKFASLRAHTYSTEHMLDCFEEALKKAGVL